jgi:HTH-type transcriptional regulator, sugar sensing transcriptional regulator
MTAQPVDETDLIDRLVRYGLGQGEARCYVVMLAPRAFRVSEVAQQAGLPRSRAYELVRSLVRSGLCTEVAGATMARFRVVPPNEAIGRLEAFANEQARRRNAALSGILHALADLPGGRRPGWRTEPVELLRRRDQVLDCYEQAMREARQEVVCLATMPWEPVDSPAMLGHLDAGAVCFRTVLERSVCSSVTHREHVGAYAARGVQARVVDRVGVHCTVFDRRSVVVNLSSPGGQGPGAQLESLLIRHGGLAQLLYEAFERLWERGVPFDQALGQPGAPAAGDGWPDPRRTAPAPAPAHDGRFPTSGTG